MSQPRTVAVSLPPGAPRRYDVAIGDGLLSTLGSRAREVAPAARAFLIVDDQLPPTLVASAEDSLRTVGYAVVRATVRAAESNKTLDTVSRLLHQLAAARLERSDPVVALGGGVVGDVAGFVAAAYLRGVPFIQCPTTLLSMVDASVGGKTGVNLAVPGAGLIKNIAGAFWQPRLVLADVATLSSLGERHLRSGLAECLKHGLLGRTPPIDDPGLFLWTSTNLLRLRMGDAALAAELIERNVRVKAAVVASDEREERPSSAGGRALLNLGHTFAHAIETIPHLSPDGTPQNAPLHHGEAVALGLVAAAATSHGLGTLSKGDEESIRVAVERLGMESRVMGLPADDVILRTMAHDKKVRSGKLRLILPVELGVCRVVEAPPESAVRAGLDAIRA